MRHFKDFNGKVVYRVTEFSCFLSFIVELCYYSATYCPNGTKFVMITQTSYLHISTKHGFNSRKGLGDMTCFVIQILPTAFEQPLGQL